MKRLKSFFLLLVIAAGCTAPTVNREGPAEGQVAGKASTQPNYEELNNSLKELVEEQAKQREERKLLGPSPDKREEQRELNLLPLK